MYSMPRDQDHERNSADRERNSADGDRNRVDHELAQMLAARFDTPLATTQHHVAWENAALRVECNQVRNVNTLEDRLAVRIVPTATAIYNAVVIPLGENGRFHLVGRYRYPVNRWSVELPRFEFDSSDAGWRATAELALNQLTGLQAARMTLLGAIEIDPALLASTAVVILAEGCVTHSAESATGATTAATAAASDGKPTAPQVESEGAASDGAVSDGDDADPSPPDAPFASTTTHADDLVAGAITANLSELWSLVRRGQLNCGVTLSALAHYQAALSSRPSSAGN